MTWGFVAATAGTIGSVAIQSRGARKAAEAQQQSTQAAIDEERRQYDQTREDYAPWRETGQRALGSLEADIGGMPTAEEVMSDPGYAFQRDQGQQALDRKISAMGGRISGAAIKATARYNQGYAGSAYGAAYQRRQDRLNRLAALAGIGQTATGASAAAGANATNAISGLIGSQGDATAGARLYQGNVWGDAANQLGAIGAMYGRKQAQPQVPVFGPTWQQRGGLMDTDSYSDFGYYGGP